MTAKHSQICGKMQLAKLCSVTTSKLQVDGLLEFFMNLLR